MEGIVCKVDVANAYCILAYLKWEAAAISCFTIYYYYYFFVFFWIAVILNICVFVRVSFCFA